MGMTKPNIYTHKCVYKTVVLPVVEIIPPNLKCYQNLQGGKSHELIYREVNYIEPS